MTADLEGRVVGHGDAPLLHVADQVLDALGDALALGGEGRLDELGVGGREVGRGQGVDVLAGQELHAGLAAAIGHGQGVGHLGEVVGVEQVGLTDVVVDRAGRPFGRGKAAVAGLGLDQRLDRFAGPGLGHGCP